MSSTTEKQGGFGAVGIIGVVVVIVIAAVAGVIVYKKQNKPPITAATTPAATTSPAPAATTPPSQQPQQSASSVYTVPELGVKFTIPNSIDDLTYQIRPVQLSNGKTTKAAYFSTKSLAKAYPKCAADQQTIAALERGEGQYPSTDDNVGTDYGPLLKQFPSFFVTFQTSRASCIDMNDAKTQKIYEQVVETLRNNIQATDTIN